MRPKYKSTSMITFPSCKQNTPKFKYFIWFRCQHLSITFHINHCIRNSWFSCDFLIWKKALETDTNMLNPYPLLCLKGLYCVYGTKNNFETRKEDCLLVFYLFVFLHQFTCTVHTPWYVFIINFQIYSWTIISLS